MKLSRLFVRTLRDAPSDTELISHKLLLQAGMVHQVSSGVYSYLPLAWRSLRKIEQIIREEMDNSGAQEVKLGLLQPREIWQKSGRDEIYGPDMIRLQDRRGRHLVLPPTNEELMTETVKSVIQSYRDLPFNLYHIQTKFRDEPRSRGGLIRVREFDMMDAYSFDMNEEGLNLSYDSMINAYINIFKRCGIETVIVEADSGAIGGKDSKEFILLSDSGEDTIVMCDHCSYSANGEKSEFTKPSIPIEPPSSQKEVPTPGVKTITQLCEYLSVSPEKTLKSVFYKSDREIITAVIRGDLEINEVKLKNSIGGGALRLATREEVAQQGLISGSASPVGMEGIKVIADDSVNLGNNFLAGANKEGYHLSGVNYPRDFQAEILTDIALAEDGFRCPNCAGTLHTKKGIEIGHVFKLGTRYSESMEAKFPDQDGNLQSVVMGCYGIGVGRILAGAIEQHADDRGIIFPKTISPYEVILTSLNTDNVKVMEASEEMYTEMSQAGIEVLWDDRQESAGVKFNDADLLGMPLRVVVSSRNMENNVVEVKIRSEQQGYTIPIQNCIEEVSKLLEK
jgi:prolyl-tRNA synthetase